MVAAPGRYGRHRDIQKIHSRHSEKRLNDRGSTADTFIPWRALLSLAGAPVPADAEPQSVWGRRYRRRVDALIAERPGYLIPERRAALRQPVTRWRSCEWWTGGDTATSRGCGFAPRIGSVRHTRITSQRGFRRRGCSMAAGEAVQLGIFKCLFSLCLSRFLGNPTS